MKQRDGASLIEVMVMITATSVVLGMVAVLIQSLQKVDRAARAQLVEAESLGQLRREFQRHVRAAAALFVEGLAGDDARLQKIELELPGGSVAKYRIDRDHVALSEERGDAVVRRERFVLPRGAAAAFEIESSAGHTIVSLVLDRKLGSKHEGDSREFRIDAALGRDRRFASKEGPK